MARSNVWTGIALSAALSLIPQAVSAQHVLVVYDSLTGHTALMADAVGEGARSVQGSEVRVLTVDKVSHGDILWADALVVGSPVHAANVTAPVIGFLENLPFDGQMKDKLGAAFVTAGGMSAGEEAAQMSILRAMLVYNMIVVGGPEWMEAFGASAVTGEGPFQDKTNEASVDSLFLEKASKLGTRVAELAKRLAPANR